MAPRSREDFLNNLKADECPVCMGPVANSFSTECRHMICLECAKKWFEDNNTCPHCRKILYGDRVISSSATPEAGRLFREAALSRAAIAYALAQDRDAAARPSDAGSFGQPFRRSRVTFADEPYRRRTLPENPPRLRIPENPRAASYGAGFSLAVPPGLFPDREQQTAPSQNDAGRRNAANVGAPRTPQSEGRSRFSDGDRSFPESASSGALGEQRLRPHGFRQPPALFAESANSGSVDDSRPGFLQNLAPRTLAQWQAALRGVEERRNMHRLVAREMNMARNRMSMDGSSPLATQQDRTLSALQAYSITSPLNPPSQPAMFQQAAEPAQRQSQLPNRFFGARMLQSPTQRGSDEQQQPASAAPPVPDQSSQIQSLSEVPQPTPLSVRSSDTPLRPSIVFRREPGLADLNSVLVEIFLHHGSRNSSITAPMADLARHGREVQTVADICFFYILTFIGPGPRGEVGFYIGSRWVYDDESLLRAATAALREIGYEEQEE